MNSRGKKRKKRGKTSRERHKDRWVNPNMYLLGFSEDVLFKRFLDFRKLVEVTLVVISAQNL